MKKRIIGFMWVTSLAVSTLVGCGKTSFKVDFMVDDKVYHTVKTNGNEKIKMPEDPFKENYTFDAWYTDRYTWQEVFTADSLLYTSLTSNMSVYAHFFSQDDIIDSSLELTGFEKINDSNVGKAYYAKVPNAKETFDFNEVVRVEGGSSWALSTDELGNNIIASKTVSLTVGNNLFYILLSSSSGASKQYPVIVRRRAMYTVTFDSAGGSAVDPQHIEEDSFIIDIPETIRPGYEFVEWNFDFSTPITKDITIKATWSPNEYHVTFDPAGGTCSTQYAVYTFGESFTLPKATREGFNFLGWYFAHEKIVSDKWNIPSDCTLTAHWQSTDPDLAIRDVTFEGATYTYDGTVKSLAISGELPEGVTVSYENNDKVDVGEYEVTAHFTDHTELYGKISDLKATLKINKAAYDFSNIKFESKSFTYDGKPHSLLIEGELPEGVSVTYQNNNKTTVGSYTVTAVFTGDTKNYNAIPNMTATMVIGKATYDMSEIKFEDKVVTYDGNPHSLHIEGDLPEGVSVTYDNNSNTKAGTYYVVAHFSGDSSNYEAIPDMSATLTIAKSKYITTGIKFESKTVTYDGQPYYLEATNLPEGVSVTYENNGKTDAGVYEVIAHFAGDAENYEPIPDMRATLTINKFEVENIKFESQTVTYDGKVHSLSVEGLPRDITVTYENNNNVNAGAYIVKAIFSKNDNYVDIPDMEATLTIEKADYDMSKVAFDDVSYTYDGKEHEIKVVGELPSGVSVSYKNNKLTNAGSITATASFNGDYDNYEKIEDKTATLSIDKLKLASPFIQYDGEYIEWNKVPFATSYIVTINGVSTETSNEYALIAEDLRSDEFTVDVKALGDESNVIESNKSNTIHRFKAISNFRIVNGSLYWNEIEGVEGYQVKVNGTSTEIVEENHYEFKNNESGSLKVEVNAVGKDDFSSTISGNASSITVNKLNSVTITYEDGEIKWSDVDNATGYSVLVDGEEIKSGDLSSYVIPDTSEEELHQITIMALGGEDYINSYSSVSIIASLVAPSFEVSGNTLSWTPITGATNYIVFINDVKYFFDKNTTSLSLEELASGNVTISIVALVNQNGIVNYSSSGEHDYTKLASVTNLVISGGMLTWDKVEGATSYIITIGDNKYEVEDNFYNFDNVLSVGSVTISVIAKAEGDTITSTNVEVKGNILKTPTLSVEDDLIKWDAVEHASKYVLSINGENVETKNTYYRLSDAGSYDIKIKSIGDDTYMSSTLSSNYSLEKLETPSDIHIASGSLTWTKVNKASSYTVVIDDKEYVVYGNTLDVRDIDTSAAISIEVYANGDDNKVIDSNKSEAETYRTLQSPNVSYDKDSKVFTWDSVLNADHYEVLINGSKVYSGINTSFDFSSHYASGYFDVRIYAIGADTRLNSNASKTSIAVYSTLNPEIRDSMFYLNDIGGVSSYDVTFNDDEPINYKTWSNGIDVSKYNDTLTSVKIKVNSNADYIYGETEYEFEADDVIKSLLIDNIEYSFNGSQFSVTGYSGDPTDVTLKSSIRGYNVVSIGDNAFNGCATLESIVIPSSITSFGSYFFKDTNIEEITINGTGEFSYLCWYLGYYHDHLSYTDNSSIQSTLKTVRVNGFTSLKAYAFYNCKYVETIVLGDSVSKMNYYTFYGCASLTSINLPNTITSIGIHDFDGNASLTSITLPSSLLHINNYAFYKCSSLNNVTLPNLVVSIGEYAFADNISLTNITLSDSLTSIGTHAFTNCNKLPTIILPSSLESIGTYAFMNCLSLDEIFISLNVKSIGVGTFMGCDNLEKITIPFVGASESTTTSYMKVFGYIFGYTTASSVTGTTYQNVSGYYYYIPSSLKTVSILSETIPSNAFYGCSNIETINILATSTTVGDYAFSDCTSIKTIKYSNRISSIGNYAFRNCTSLTSISIGASSIGLGAFKGCTSLESITLPFVGQSASATTGYMTVFGYIFGYTTTSATGTTYQGTSGYYYYIPSSIRSVTITGTKISNYAFYNCINLTSITLASGTTTIPTYAFANCTHLTSFTIPDTVTAIYSHAFESCLGITEIIVPDSVTAISNTAFYLCSNLVSITLPFTGYSTSTTNTYAKVFGYIFGYATSSTSGTTYQGISGYYYYIPASIRSVTITGTSVPAYAFYGCSKLTTINIPSTVTAIGNSAFYGCSSLTSFTLPSSLASIGTYAFAGCSGFTSIAFPDKLTSINAFAFQYCSGLTEIIVPDNVTTIGEGAFKSCTKIASITLPFVGMNATTTTAYQKVFGYIFGFTTSSESGTTYQGTSGYYYYIPSSIKTVTITGSTIPSYAFYGCTKIETFNIPSTVTTINSYAFYNCTSMESFVFPSSLTTIGSYAFYNCSSLSSFNLPTSLKTINASAFSYCAGLTSIDFPNTVETIGTSSFVGCTGLTEIVVPDSVTTIGSGAFKSCTSLASITLPFVGTRTTTTVNYNCVFGYIFGYVTTSVSGTTYQGISGYYYYIPASLRTVTITGASIPANAFYGCSKLTAINIPSTITSIDDYAFYGCSSLASFTLPESLTTIGSYSFSYCTGLTSISFPSKLTSIGNYAFQGCIGFTEVVVPDSVTTILEGAFRYCNNLISITLPFVGQSISATSSSLKVFGYIFGYTTSSTNGSSYQGTNGNYYYYIPASLKTIIITGSVIPNNAFWNCSKLTTINIPSTVTIIGDYAFYGCSSLTSFTIPESIITIGSYAFDGCAGLTSIKLPNTVTSIGQYAFHSCTGLTEIIVPISVTSIGKSAFVECTKLISITLPFVGASASTTTSYMKVFGYIFGYVTTSVSGTTYQGISGYYYYIPSSIKTVTITGTSIPAYAFSGCKNIVEVRLPNVTSIGTYAFQGCSSINSVFFGYNGIVSIGDSAFASCSSLRTLYVYSNFSTTSLDAGNDWLAGATRYIYAETKPEVAGNYWRYVDGVPTIWEYQ